MTETVGDGGMLRVIITDATSYKAAVVARYLKLAYPHLHLLGTDHRPASRWARTRWLDQFQLLPCGPSNPDLYVEALAGLVRTHEVELLLPVNSTEIRLLIEKRDLFGKTFAYTGDSNLYRRLDDKALFSELAGDAGAPQPRRFESFDAPPPLVVKPRRGSSSKGVRYLITEAEVAAARQELGAEQDAWIIQEFVTGEGVGYSGYFEDGAIKVGYAHRRVAEYPVSGGSSVVRERYPYDDRPTLEALIKQLLAVAPWSGFAMFELKRRGPGDFVFIECNPRIWGSINQGLNDGENYFEPLLGPGLPQRGKARTELLPLSWLALGGYLARGQISKVKEIVWGWGRTDFDIDPIGDPLGFLALLMRGR